ncbi:MAG: hypothetical protein ACE5E1_04645 [Phycisphaerae bacterium]
MTGSRYRTTKSGGLVISALLACASGCADGGSRNIQEAVTVVSGPALSEANVRFVLELRQSRKEIALADVDAFLSGDASTDLGYGVRADLRRKSRKLRETLAEATAAAGEGLAITRPDRERPFSGGNLVVYVRGRDGFHAYCSSREVDGLFAYPEVADDLTTVRYTHPLFDVAVLDRLKAGLKERQIETPNIALSADRLEALKCRTATGILEKKLRSLGMTMSDEAPLLASATFGRTCSPKLTRALSDAAALEGLISCGEPEVIRALVYLVNADIVEISSF